MSAPGDGVNDGAARLFVAAWPDAALRDRLLALPRPDEDGVRWSPAANWHVTLRFLGTVEPEPVVERLREADLPASRLRLGPTIERLGDRVVVLPVAGADELAAAIRAATLDIAGPDRYDFRGHLTLARMRDGCSLIGEPFEAVLPVDEVALVRSDTTADGARYTALATFATA